MDTTREAFKQHWRRLWERMENGEETACPDEWARLVSLAGQLAAEQKEREQETPEKPRRPDRSDSFADASPYSSNKAKLISARQRTANAAHAQQHMHTFYRLTHLHTPAILWL